MLTFHNSVGRNIQMLITIKSTWRRYYNLLKHFIRIERKCKINNFFVTVSLNFRDSLKHFSYMNNLHIKIFFVLKILDKMTRSLLNYSVKELHLFSLKHHEDEVVMTAIHTAINSMFTRVGKYYVGSMTLINSSSLPLSQRPNDDNYKQLNVIRTCSIRWFSFNKRERNW